MNEAQRTRLLQVLGMTGSIHNGEAISALRIAQRLMRESGIGWPDLLNGAAELPLREEIRQLQHRLSVATAACRKLLHENDALKSAVALGGETDWTEAGDHRNQAKWALGLHRVRTVQLRRFELDFLTTVSSWNGNLTPKQAPIFSRIIGRLAAEYGQRPPP
jgi:hypothetical protein